MSDFYIYIMGYLRAGKEVYYVGHTNDMTRRFNEHMTEPRRWFGAPIIVGVAPTRGLAMRGEALVKKWSHGMKRLALEVPRE